jgi:hypothetical protein
MKFRVGDVVRTKRGAVHEVSGPIHEIIQPSRELQLLWGHREPHYLVRDNQSGEYISVVEGGLEKV